MAMMRLITVSRPKVFASLLVLLIAALSLTLSLDYLPGAIAAMTADRPVIMLDPGHGGADSGVFAGRLAEKDITLEIARHLRDYLTDSGCRVIMLRNRDVDFGGADTPSPYSLRRDLAYRTAAAVERKPDILLSLHVASHGSSVFYGPQTFYFESNFAASQLAGAVQDNLAAVWPGNCPASPIPSRREILAAAPGFAVAVETGFLSNRTDRMLLQDPLFKRQIARSISQGVITFLNSPPCPSPVGADDKIAAAPLGPGYSLYYEAAAPNPGELIPIQRPLPQTMEVTAGLTESLSPEATAALALSLLEELCLCPPDNLPVFPPLPSSIVFDSVTIRGGTAVINLAAGLSEIWDSNTFNEETTINSIVRTVKELPGIKKVQILLDGEAEVSLAGHMVLGRFHE
jgi:N-acetylmuramoyl-L-alanine amidase